MSTPRAQSQQVGERSPSQLTPSQRPPPQFQQIASAQSELTTLSTVRALDAPVAIVVYTTRYIVGKTTAIEKPRHVVILNRLRTNFDHPVICNESMILTPIEWPQEPPFSSRMRPNSCDDMLLVYSEVLRTHFTILYDRESTLNSLRFATPPPKPSSGFWSSGQFPQRRAARRWPMLVSLFSQARGPRTAVDAVDANASPE